MAVTDDAAVGIIPVSKGEGEQRFCLVKHAAGHWGFPKGHQDPGESEETTALREAREEAGIEIAQLDTSRIFTENYEFEKKGMRYNKTVRYFLATVRETDNATPAEFKNEILDMRWLSYNEALSVIRSQSKPLLKEAWEYLNKRLE